MSTSFSTSTSLSSSPDHDQLDQAHSRTHSLPCLPNPNLLKIENQLKNLNSSPLVASTSTDPEALEWISSKLINLSNLYLSLEDLISCPLTQKSLLRHGHGRLVEQVLETSVTFLSIISTVKDHASSMKDQLGDLQSALRRRGGEGERYGVSSYLRFRKSSNREISEAVRELKEMMKKSNYEMDFNVEIMKIHCDEDVKLGMVAKVLSEVAVTTAGILRSLLSSFSIPVETSKAKRQLQIFMSKIGVKGTAQWNSSDGLNRLENVINEVGSVDLALISCDDLVRVQGRMRTLEIELQRIEGSLDGMSRCLVQYRVSFLNMLAN